MKESTKKKNRRFFMLRKIIEISEERCNGCGKCADACHEGAIGMVNGKAKLLRDDYCDGLGDCLPACPVDAIRFVEREAAPYDEQAVRANMAARKAAKQPFSGCPGMALKQFDSVPASAECMGEEVPSQLHTWPIQIKLAPVNAPFFQGAELLIAADCTAFAYGDFHRKFLSGKVALIGCPKLDAVNYSEKLTEILRNNDIQSVTIVRMEVPCCGGLEMAAKKAIQDSGKFLPWQVVTIAIDGEILE